MTWPRAAARSRPDLARWSAIVGVVAVLIVPGQASAAPAQTKVPTGTVDLVRQSSWVQGDQPFELRLRVGATGPTDDLEVAVTVYRRVTSRSEFSQTVEGRMRNAGFDQVRFPLVDLVPGEDGTVGIEVPTTPGREGIYPVRVEVREKRGGPVLDALMTHLVYLPEPVAGDGLKVGWVVPVHAPPALQPDGTIDLAPDAAARLGVLADALARHPDVRLSLRPTPETIAALETSGRESDRATLASLVAARRGRQLLGGHFATTSLPGLLAAGLETEAAAQLSEGIATLSRTFADKPDGRTWVSEERLDAATVEQVAGQQYDRLVIPEASLAPVDVTTTLTQTFNLDTRQRRLRVAASEPGLAARMVEDTDPTLAAYNLLAELAVVYFEKPGRPGGVVVAPPRSWQPNATFLDTFLSGLETSPILTATTLDEVFDSVPTGPPTGGMVRRIAPAPAGATGIPVGPLRTVRRRLDAFGTVLEPGNPLIERIERRLLVSQAADVRPRARTSYLDGARDEIDAQLAMIAIPAKRSITLTARKGEIPVTISSRATYPVRAVLQVQSGTLEFPSGDRRVLDLNRRNTTERIQVEARGSGSFPLRVRLESPDGSLVLAESLFTVRSTAASGVGLGISVGAATFLLVWWGSHLRGRRSRRLVPA